MANTYTTRFNLTKPEVGADTNAWGGHLNANLDTIDSNMVSLSIATTQTMTGALALPSNGLNVGSGQLNVTGGNVSMSGNASAVNGAFSGTLGVTGAATLSSTLAVTGAATFSSTLTASTAPTAAGHLTNKTYVDGVDALKLNLAGGTMTGQIQFTVPSGSFLDPIVYNLSSSRKIYLSATDATSKEWYVYDTGLAGGAARLRSDGSGNLIAYANVTAYSDARLKENVETISNALNLVNRMRGVFYDRIDTGEAGIGVIAQEMEEVIPEVVIPSDGVLTVAYGNLVGVLIEAVKELSAKVDALEGKQ